jgi:asparagine synthase (glutamine-hydrolysing)
MYEAARLASRHVKVVLTGDGGDEVFAGYDRYFGFRWAGVYGSLPEPIRRHLLGPAIGALPESGAYKSLTQRARWLHQLSFDAGGRRFAQATAFFRFGAAGRGGLYRPAVAALLAGHDPLGAVVEAFEAAVAEDDVDRMLLADLATRLPEHSLALTDRMTMAHGLEARSPLLDHLLVEQIATLPVRYKLRGTRLKHLARLVARDLLPARIVDRPKQGFMFPLASWLKGPLRRAVAGLGKRSALVAEGLLDGRAIERLAAEHGHRQADHHARLWMLLNLEVWFRMYQRGEQPGAVEEWLARPVAA